MDALDQAPPHRANGRGHDTEGVASMRDEPSTKACAWCGDEFTRRSWMKPKDWRAAKHCSISCGRKAAWEGKRAKPRSCDRCGARISQESKTGRCTRCVYGTLQERFDAKVEKGDDCWLWTGYRDKHGYGQMRVDGKTQTAHRVAYELYVGPIPESAHLDHLCRNPSCVNPDHLKPVTPAENLRRGELGELKETCANGHPWVPENWASNGKYKCCAICHRQRVRDYKRKKREQAQAVADAGGIEEARRKLVPSEYRAEVAA